MSASEGQIRKLYDAGVGSTFPAASIARTLIVCDALDRLPYVAGEVQGVQAPQSSEHWNVALSVAVNQNVADFGAGLDHCVNDVSGGVVSGGGAIVATCIAATFPAAEAVIIGEPGSVSR